MEDVTDAVFRRLWDELGISYTRFIRTTSPEHASAVRRMLLHAQDAGYIYKSFYEGRYCVYDNLYVTDNTEPIDCPLCGRPAACSLSARPSLIIGQDRSTRTCVTRWTWGTPPAEHRAGVLPRAPHRVKSLG